MCQTGSKFSPCPPDLQSSTPKAQRTWCFCIFWVCFFWSLKSFMCHTKSTGLNFSSCLDTTNTAHYSKDWREMIIAHNGMFMTLILRCLTLVSYFYYHLVSSKRILASRCKFGNTLPQTLFYDIFLESCAFYFFLPGLQYCFYQSKASCHFQPKWQSLCQTKTNLSSLKCYSPIYGFGASLQRTSTT